MQKSGENDLLSKLTANHITLIGVIQNAANKIERLKQRREWMTEEDVTTQLVAFVKSCFIDTQETVLFVQRELDETIQNNPQITENEFEKYTQEEMDTATEGGEKYFDVKEPTLIQDMEYCYQELNKLVMKPELEGGSDDWRMAMVEKADGLNKLILKHQVSMRR